MHSTFILHAAWLDQACAHCHYYRYNYIELWKATDHRRREFQFIRALERWGVAQARTPRSVALLLSRASEDWWDNTHGTYWLGESAEAKKGFWTSRLVSEFFLQNGYPFDLYWLDQEDGLARLGEYKLLLVPFPYSVSQAGAEALRRAAAGGAKLLVAQQRGEVNEYGTPYAAPVLQELIEKGAKDGSVVFLDRDLVEWEVAPSFADDFGRIVDGLLGPNKPLRLNRCGHRVEAHLLEKPPEHREAGASRRELFLTLINWGDPADIEVGLNLPKGSYEVLTLSSDNPALEAEGRIGGQAALSESDLARFAVGLGKNEVRTLLISSPTNRK